MLPGTGSHDVNLEQLERNRGLLSEVIYKRAPYCYSHENARVLDMGEEALEAGDIVRFGKRMVESHRSLRDLCVRSAAENWI